MHHEWRHLNTVKFCDPAPDYNATVSFETILELAFLLFSFISSYKPDPMIPNYWDSRSCINKCQLTHLT